MGTLIVEDEVKLESQNAGGNCYRRNPCALNPNTCRSPFRGGGCTSELLRFDPDSDTFYSDLHAPGMGNIPWYVFEANAVIVPGNEVILDEQLFDVVQHPDGGDWRRLRFKAAQFNSYANSTRYIPKNCSLSYSIIHRLAINVVIGFEGRIEKPELLVRFPTDCG